MASTGRSKGYRITASQRLVLGRKLRKLLAVDDSLTVEDLVRKTGAPFDMCNFIKKRFREEQRNRTAASA